MAYSYINSLKTGYKFIISNPTVPYLREGVNYGFWRNLAKSLYFPYPRNNL